MVKTANPWLRGLLRAGKQQQRAAGRIMKGLLAPPKPGAPARARPKAAPKPKAAPAPAPIRKAPAAPGAGKWLACHYAGLPAPGAAAKRRMSYWLYLPASAGAAPPGAGMPMIVMLHGCDQSAPLFAQGTRMNQLAETKGYAVLYPQQSARTHPRRCWKWYDRATQQGGGDVGPIVGIVRQVIERYPIDRSRIYICGISAGAGMANIVALNHPELFAAVGMHSGPIFGAGHSAVGALGVMQHGAGSRVGPAIAEATAGWTDFPPLPTILIHGQGDHVVRPLNQAQLARQAMLVNRLPADSRVELVDKAGNKRAHAYQLRDVYRGRKLMLREAQIADLKHAWSGGDASLSFNSGAGPDASRMMLSFFARHRRLPAARPNPPAVR